MNKNLIIIAILFNIDFSVAMEERIAQEAAIKKIVQSELQVIQAKGSANNTLLKKVSKIGINVSKQPKAKL